MKKIVLIAVVVILLVGGYWLFSSGRLEGIISGQAALSDLTSGLVQQTADEQDAGANGDQIGGSGTVEADEIVISSELGGRIVSVSAAEGDEVLAGQELVALETSDLQAQRAQAEAAVETARANLIEAKSGPRPEDVESAKAELAKAETSSQLTKGLWEETQSVIQYPQDVELSLADLQGQLAVADKNIEMAGTFLKEAEIQRDEALRSQDGDAAIIAQQIAQKQVVMAEVDVKIAQAARDGIQAQINELEEIRDYPVQLIVNANQAGSAYSLSLASEVAAAANLASSEAMPRAVDVAVAEAQLAEAEAVVEKIDIMLDEMVMESPRDGVVLDRSVQVGELAIPGRVLMTVADLDQVKLTVFVPETQIGRVREGQAAKVAVDAYSGEVFDGTVVYISPEAEFTPKNVQTKEERVNLVFAVKIRLDNADHRLKPGMPADAVIVAD